MIEVLIVLLVLGAATVVFYPALAGTAGRTSATKKPNTLTDDDREELETLGARKARVLRNLHELDTERAAGRIGETEYEDLKRRDEAEAARVLRDLSSLEAGGAGRAGKAGTAKSRVGTRLAWIGGVAAFGIAERLDPGHLLVLLRQIRRALRNSAYFTSSSKSAGCNCLAVRSNVARLSLLRLVSDGKKVIIDMPKKRASFSRSSRLGLYIPVSHLDIVLGATLRYLASAS